MPNWRLGALTRALGSGGEGEGGIVNSVERNLIGTPASTPSFMQFCYIRRLRRNAIKTLYKSVCDDLYHACTFARGILRALFTPHWKMLQR